MRWMLPTLAVAAMIVGGATLSLKADDHEEDNLDKGFDIQMDSRLGCCATIEKDGDLEVHITEESLDAYYNEHPKEKDLREE